MKKVIGLVGMVVALSGCNGLQQDISHAQSELFGLNRTITLYNADGGVIKTWETDSTIQDQGGSIRFMVKGKAVTLAGTWLAEEK